MSKVLVIVESPAKERSLQSMLGKAYEVRASMGHLIDLPKSKLGVDVEADFRPHYITIRGKGKLLKALKAEARKAETLLLACDPDPEGEALAAHLADAFEIEEGTPCRLLLSEITKEAVDRALARLVPIDRARVEGQQARRILDRIVGYQLSPLLWRKLQWGLSAGRVQSAVLAMLVERNEAIEAFRRRSVWTLAVEVASDRPRSPSLHLVAVDGEGRELHLPKRDAMDSLLLGLRTEAYVVRAIERTNRAGPAPLPFTTSTLLQEAARRFDFSTRKTMVVAQQLYEGVEMGRKGPQGLITFMRSDSTRIGNEAREAIRAQILERWGEDFLDEASPETARSPEELDPRSSEAIRPCRISLRPRDVKKHLSEEQYQLYRLIWTRTLASMMKPAFLVDTVVDVEAGPTPFRATGCKMGFDGFRRAYEKHGDLLPDFEDRLLPPLRKGERLRLLAERPEKQTTRPEADFTEASLVEAMTELGIGRPSTHAALVSTLLDRKYVERRKEKLVVTELGLTVHGLLREHFASMMDPKEAAGIEARLDATARGEDRGQDLLRDFYEDFKPRLAAAEAEMKSLKEERVETDIRCPECGKIMLIKRGRYGKFIACSGYPDCRHTSELVGTGAAASQPEKPETETLDEPCELCGAAMQMRRGRYGRFKACSTYPECKNTVPLLNKVGLPCPEAACSGEVVCRFTRRKRMFYGCSRYPDCAFSSWVRPAGGDCPQCGKYLVERRSKESLEAIVCSDRNCAYRRDPDDGADGAS